MRVVRRLAGFVLGAVAGLFAGTGLVVDLPTRRYEQDLLPGPAAWGPWYWLTVGSLFLALAAATFAPRLRSVAVGWLVGVPVLLVIALAYNWHVWGRWGSTPTIP